MAASYALCLRKAANRFIRRSSLPLGLRSASILCRRRTRHQTVSLPDPPRPKKVPFMVSAHGRTWQDPYHWMSQTDDPDLSRHLQCENSYAEAFMADTLHLQRTLFSEMSARLPPAVSTPPECWGPWLYFQYIPQGKEYPVLCRKPAAVDRRGWARSLLSGCLGIGGLGEMEEVLLDWNAIAEQYGYVHVGECRVSPDHSLLAYTLDITGSERLMLQIKDLKTGFQLPKSRVDGVVSLAWAQDGSTLFYTVCDENLRPNRVLCTGPGLDAVDGVLVFIENDPRFCIDITSTKDGKFITVNSNSRSSSEVYVIDATKPHDSLKKIRKRVPGVQYFLEHHHGFFYILTNTPLGKDIKLNFRDYHLVRCPVKDVQSDDWKSIIMPTEDIALQDMDMFNGHLVLFINKNGSSMVCSINMPIDVSCKGPMEIDDLKPWYFPLPSDVCSIVSGSNHDFNNTSYRVILSSPVMPDIVVDYEMSQRKFSIVHQEKASNVFGSTASKLPTHGQVASNISDAKKNKDLDVEELGWKNFNSVYYCERKEIFSYDGAQIPLTIVFSQKAWVKGQYPGILHGYGAYGEVLDKNWCTDRLSLLDRGWVVAFADVRGGGGSDSSWHKSGTGLCKLNSIYDFISCGKYLVDEGYVHKDCLSTIAYSAGSLLVGAAINMCPDLFCAAILKVPFVDICNTLLDPSLPLTMLDYEEFGNPQIKSQFEYILSYSPYDNILQGACHPSMLVTASFRDSRVGVWEAAKWVAKLRNTACPNCSHSIILKTNMSGGHFSEGGHFGRSEETAYDYAFLMKAVGFLEDEK